MTKIKLNWKYAQGELDTDTLKLVCLPARGKRIFGADELDAELCIKDGMNFQIAEIHLGDVESSNILCEEIVRRFLVFLITIEKLPFTSVTAAVTIRLLASRSTTLAIITGPKSSVTVPEIRVPWANAVCTKAIRMAVTNNFIFGIIF